MWYPFRVFIRVLPLNLIYFIGVTGGNILYYISKKKSKIISEELKLILPNISAAQMQRIIRSCFENYCVSEIEVLLYPLMNRKLMEKMVKIEGKEYLDNALSNGKGVILFQAHFGAFQMVMPAIGYNGYAMNQISASASVWKMDSNMGIQKKSLDLKARYEYTLPVRHISIASSMRPAFRALENNEILGITVDGGGGKKVVPVKFLGRDANFQRGGADIAIRTGAEVIPAFIITEKGLKHRLILHPRIAINNEMQDKNENIKRVMQEFAKTLEGYVLRYPNHYGYSLYLRKERMSVDPYPFFLDHAKNDEILHSTKGINYA